MPVIRVRVIDPRESSGCGCLIGSVLVIAVIALVSGYGAQGAFKLGDLAYALFHHGNEIHGANGHAFALGTAYTAGVLAAIAAIIALISRRKAAIWAAAFLLSVTAVAGVIAGFMPANLS